MRHGGIVLSITALPRTQRREFARRAVFLGASATTVWKSVMMGVSCLPADFDR